MQLQGRRALVTGGASGIGLAVAKRFVAEGARVVIADMSDKNATAAVAESGGKFGKTIGDVAKLARRGEHGQRSRATNGRARHSHQQRRH